MNFLVDRTFTEREMRLANQRQYRRHYVECISCHGNPRTHCVLCLSTGLITKATAEQHFSDGYDATQLP